MALRTGWLNQPATLQDRVEQVGDSGGFDPSFVGIGRVYLSIEPTSGDEGTSAGHTEARLRVKVKMHYQRGVKPHQRLVYDDGHGERTLEIVKVVDVHGRHSELDLTCLEVLK